eukprot:Hpha_TRINITY_DN8625_c0_g1::TRINITY_DN8625_c0_g1_i2::g.168537::m.168537
MSSAVAVAAARQRVEQQEYTLVLVSSYTSFENLAHRPHGVPAKEALRVFHMDTITGRLTLLHVLLDDECRNPAFIRCHPARSVVWVVTEDVHKENRLLTYSVSPASGRMHKLRSIGSGGKSTCYIYPSRDLSTLLLVNYWDSSVSSFKIDAEGRPLRMLHVKSCQGENSAAPQQHGDDPHGTHRSKETHAHAVVLDPRHARQGHHSTVRVRRDQRRAGCCG